MTHTMLFDWIYENEGCAVSLDGQPIIMFDHADHGPEGARGIEEALLAVAEIIGAEVVVSKESLVS